MILPALEAALHRRSHELSQQQKSTTREEKSEALHLQIQTHEQIRKCTAKISRLFRELDHWDRVAPVGMGDGVEGLLEGFLEEILCRVEAEDV